MEIYLNKVRPFPISIPKNYIPTKRYVWGNDCLFEATKQYKIIAPSGTGKSTLTHILAGIRHDYDGEIAINNINIKSFSSSDWEKTRTSEFAFVFQSLKLFPQLTVLENLTLKSEWCMEYQTKTINKYAEKLGLSPFMNIPVSKLSFGQCQRIAIIRAICQPFKWIILDEPFSHLDATNRDIAWNLIQQVAEEKNAGIILCLLDEIDSIQVNQTFYLSRND